jgi:hypothetical protein
MSELREFVADLLERQGAAIEALAPDGLEVLAPATLRKQLGWPELAHLSFGTESAHGTIAIGLEGDWLDRFGTLLADQGRWSEREVRPPVAVLPPSDAERVLDHARPAERGLAVPGNVRNVDALPDAGVPLHRGVGREA